MNFTFDEFKTLIEIIGFEKATIYNLNSKFLSKEYNKGYIGAYQYEANILHLYLDKASLYYFDVSSIIKVDDTTSLSFQRLSFDKAYNKLIKAFPKELRKLKIQKILKNNL